MDMSLRPMLKKQLSLCICLGLLLIISESVNGARGREETNGMSCKKMDVTLLLDSSKNVRSQNFEFELEFARRLVESLDIGPDNVRLAIIYYGGKAQTHFDLNQFLNVEDVMEALPKIPYVGGIANISGAIWRMRTNIFTRTSGDRPGVPNLGIIVSGGNSSDKESTINEAKLARNSGIMLYYVGKIPNTDFREALGIISKEQYGFFFSKWDKYMTSERAAESITERLCRFVPLEEIFIDSVNQMNSYKLLM